MNFHSETFLEDVIMAFDPKGFMERMKEIGMIGKERGYAHDCYNLCRNATAHVIAELKKMDTIESYLFLEEMVIADGSFGFRPHTWIVLGDYYIDLTLKQFMEEAPELAITLKEESGTFGNYQAHELNSVSNWIRIQIDEPVQTFKYGNQDSQIIELNGKKIKI